MGRVVHGECKVHITRRSSGPPPNQTISSHTQAHACTPTSAAGCAAAAARPPAAGCLQGGRARKCKCVCGVVVVRWGVGGSVRVCRGRAVQDGISSNTSKTRPDPQHCTAAHRTRRGPHKLRVLVVHRGLEALPHLRLHPRQLAAQRSDALLCTQAAMAGRHGAAAAAAVAAATVVSEA